MKLRFQCPLNGIPCIAEWDEEGEILQFDFEDFEEAIKTNTKQEIGETVYWCMQNVINCHSIHQANRHLDFLEIDERFKEKENHKSVNTTLKNYL
ncbi:hypothetical protein D1872_211480 [compost metagenome]